MQMLGVLYVDCGWLPGSVYVVAVGFWVVYRLFISGCSTIVVGCQGVSMGLWLIAKVFLSD